MSAVVAILAMAGVVVCLLTVAYVVLLVLDAIERERQRRVTLIRAQQADARMRAASVQAMQQMLLVARQAQDPDRP